MGCVGVSWLRGLTGRMHGSWEIMYTQVPTGWQSNTESRSHRHTVTESGQQVLRGRQSPQSSFQAFVDSSKCTNHNWYPRLLLFHSFLITLAWLQLFVSFFFSLSLHDEARFLHHYFTFLRVFHNTFGQWLVTEVWVTASVLKPAWLSSVFQPTLTMP